MRILCILLFSFCFSITVSAQNKQDYVWITGYDLFAADGTTVMTGNFNNDNFKWELTEKLMSFDSNNASICDNEGNLLLYFNGCMLANGQNDLVENGDEINSGEFQDLFWSGCVEAGYPGSQDVMILPDPANEAGYYLFHKRILYNQEGRNPFELNYTYITDISSKNEQGLVTEKNIKYHSNLQSMGSYFTAISNQDQSGYWIIQPLVEDSLFLTFYLSSSGVEFVGEQNTHQFFNAFRSSSGGTAKFSPDGTKYALYNYFDQLHLYDFDRATGMLSNHQKIEIFPDSTIDHTTIAFSSVEWSPSSRFAYCASSLDLHQVDTWETDPQDGVRHIAEYVEFLDPFQTDIRLQALAPDCKIYIVPGSGTGSYHVINKPDEIGTSCDFVQNGIDLPAFAAGRSFPNFPRFRVDEEDKCDPTITSVFGDAVYYRRDLEVYPSPTQGPISVEISDDWSTGKLVVLNLEGQLVWEEDISRGTTHKQIDLTHFPAGHYNVELYPDSNAERIFYGKQVVVVK